MLRSAALTFSKTCAASDVMVDTLHQLGRATLSQIKPIALEIDDSVGLSLRSAAMRQLGAITRFTENCAGDLIRSRSSATAPSWKRYFVRQTCWATGMRSSDTLTARLRRHQRGPQRPSIQSDSAFDEFLREPRQS